MAAPLALRAFLAVAMGLFATTAAAASQARGPCATPLTRQDISQVFGGAFRATDIPLVMQVNAFRQDGCDFEAVAPRRGVTRFMISIRRATDLEGNLVLRRDAAQDLVDEGWAATPVADLGDAAYWTERVSGTGASHQLLLFRGRFMVRLLVWNAPRDEQIKARVVALAQKVSSRLQAAPR